MTFLRRERVKRTARCDSVLLTAHDVLIIATDDDDDAGTAKWILRSSNDESARPGVEQTGGGGSRPSH